MNKNIARVVIVFLLFVVFSGFNGLYANKIVFDYVFLIDTSGSMVGKPAGSNNVNIFPKVKNAIIDFFGDIELGSNIFVFQFDRGIHSEKRFFVKSREDIKKAQKYIKDLKAEGLHTWIYRSIETVNNKINEFVKNSEDKHAVIFYIYTDGLDNDQTYRKTLKEIMEYYNVKRGENDWLFYVTLGVKLSDEDRKIFGKYKNVEYMKEKKGIVRPIMIVENRIPVLFYGNLWDEETGKKSALFKVHNRNKLPSNFRINANIDFTELSQKGLGLKLKKNSFTMRDIVELGISLVNFDKEMSECRGSHKAYINLSSSDDFVYIIPNKIEVNFKYEAPSIVEISTDSGIKENFNFGLQKSYDKKVDLHIKLKTKFNDIAMDSDGLLEVIMSLSDKNPMKLKNDKNFKINGRGKYIVPLKTDIDGISVNLLLNKDLKAGKYEGKIKIKGKDLIVKTKIFDYNKTEKDVIDIPFSFIVAEKPLSMTVKIIYGLIALAVILIIIYFVYIRLFKPKRINLIITLEDFDKNGIKEELDCTDVINKKEVINGEAVNLGDKFSESCLNSAWIYLKRKKDKVFVENYGNYEIQFNGVVMENKEEIVNNSYIRSDKFMLTFKLRKI